VKKPRTDARQKRFVEEYLIDLDATKAADRSGYSKKTAGQIGYQLLQKTSIQKAIARTQKKRSERLEITADMWLRELWIIGRSNIENYIKIDEGGLIIAKTFEEMPPDASRALEAIEENRTIKESADGSESNILNSKIKFKLHSKIDALKLIGQHLGFLKDPKIEIPGLEKALYEISEKFLPTVKKTQNDGPK
jgi:phage terminase small subunit